MEFGRFRIIPARRELLVDGQPFELGDRAFDTLLALTDTPGAVQSKEALMHRVWPDRIVEENNLEVQISMLRKAFGADRNLIRTVAGRGYQFTGEIHARAPASATLARLGNIPASLSELIGRERELEEVRGLFGRYRLVTLVGPGGIGKTRLALELARGLGATFPDGVFLVGLAALTSPELIPFTVAASLGLPLVADAVSARGITVAIGTRRLLLVLDNCEHVVDGVARLAETLLGATPAAGLLATSREAVRASGEYVYRVPSLAVPEDDGDSAVEEILQHDAVRLFVTRARAAEPQFTADAGVVAAVGAICRRLDGMPLAIELAAARVPSFGVEGIASRLDDRFGLLTRGNRTALQRHQTLRATLDWSYDLLSEPERAVLGRLAIFTGSFDGNAAGDVAVSKGMSAADVTDALGALVAKSLLTVDLTDVVARYRLLESTRAYALEKLAERGELGAMARRHAEHHLAICERVDLAGETTRRDDRPAVYGRAIDNVRAALDWAFSPAGDPALGVALTVAAVPLWMHLSLMSECRARVEQALACLGAGVPADARRDMRLFHALGTALLHTRGIGSPEMSTAAMNALELAERLDDTEYRLRATYCLCVHRFVNGEYRAALALADTLRAIAAKTDDPADVLIADRLVGAVLHGLGDQPAARRRIEPLLEADLALNRPLQIVRYHFDQRVVTHCYHARILWVQGFADRALQTVADVVDLARATDHVISQLYALFEAACPLALYAGDLARGRRFIELIRELSVKHAMTSWDVWGQCYEGMLLMKEGNVAAGVPLLQAGLDALPPAAFHLHRNMLRGELAEGLAARGQVDEGLALLDDALARADRVEERWCYAELLRKKGEGLLLRDTPADSTAAADCFVKALDWAQRQEALAWELRAATSLARLLRRQRRHAQARTTLAPVYRRFTEGFKTADLLTAKSLLASLH